MKSLIGFSVQEPRKLPVILLLDTSYSMTYKLDNQKKRIDVLHEALSTMLTDFTEANKDGGQVRIEVSIITFGNKTAQLVHELKAPELITNCSFKPEGNTPLSKALHVLESELQNTKRFNFPRL